MGTSEIFNQLRMERCAAIHRAILENWQKTTSSPYTVRATAAVAGIALSELRLHYFAVGAGEDLVEIPFHDMLVVFVMIEQTTAAMRQLDRTTTAGTIQFKISTVFPDDEALRLLNRIRIETPFDAVPYLTLRSES